MGGWCRDIQFDLVGRRAIVTRQSHIYTLLVLIFWPYYSVEIRCVCVYSNHFAQPDCTSCSHSVPGTSLSRKVVSITAPQRGSAVGRCKEAGVTLWDATIDCHRAIGSIFGQRSLATEEALSS